MGISIYFSGSVTTPTTGEKFEQGDKTINIYDELGRVIYINQTMDNKVQVNVNNINGGLYFVEVTKDGKHDVAKIIISNDK